MYVLVSLLSLCSVGNALSRFSLLRGDDEQSVEEIIPRTFQAIMTTIT